MIFNSRVTALAFGAITIALGLGSRRYAEWLPDFVGQYVGDVLWAFLVFWLLVAVAPLARTRVLAGVALLIAVLVELSQLSSAAWLETLRSNRLGALVLGQGFLVSDLWCYAIGVALAALFDRSLGRPGLRINS